MDADKTITAVFGQDPYDPDGDALTNFLSVAAVTSPQSPLVSAAPPIALRKELIAGSSRRWR
ncbi:MAG: hypothetical protein NTW21_13660 [Verrucomicrobia bacterium]|nr:hypothetical protein [Verrucomicrobiota bacterium]